MFKDIEIKQFYFDLIAHGTDSKKAINQTITKYQNRLVVNYEFQQYTNS